VVVLHGPAGIGKTQLALEFCNRKALDFSTVFWINAESTQSIKVAYKDFANTLLDFYAAQSRECSDFYDQFSQHMGLGLLMNSWKADDPKLDSTSLIIDSMKEWFSIENNKDWLMIFDNVDDQNDLDITAFFPNAVRGRILLISRDTICVKKHKSKELKLEGMKEEESRELLLQKYHNDHSEDDGKFSTVVLHTF
jgi:hypothetical protein